MRNLKRLFKPPQDTPNAALIRGDTGCLRIEHIIHKKQRLYMMKIKTAGDDRWVKQIGMYQDKYYTYGPNIITRMNNLCNQYNIISLPKQTKQEQKVWKDKLQEEIKLRANKEFQEQLQNMSKTQDLSRHKKSIKSMPCCKQAKYTGYPVRGYIYTLLINRDKLKRLAKFVTQYEESK